MKPKQTINNAQTYTDSEFKWNTIAFYQKKRKKIQYAMCCKRTIEVIVYTCDLK